MKFTIDTNNKTIEIVDEIKINDLMEQLNKMDVDYKEYTIVPVRASVNIVNPVDPRPIYPYTDLKYMIWYTTDSTSADKNNTVK